MEEKDYLETRLEDQIIWYDKKSSSNQQLYKRFRIVEIIAAACIPFLAGFSSKSETIPFLWIIGILGVLVTVFSGILMLYKFNERWIEYRTTSESLKHHKYLFLTRTNPYNDENAFSLFVSNVEGLISEENSKWTIQMRDKKKDKKDS